MNPPWRERFAARGKGMLPFRFFQQSHREAMQSREEKTIGLTAADWVRLCRATYSRGFRPPDMPQNEREHPPSGSQHARRLS
jgi:hypothetical protein